MSGVEKNFVLVIPMFNEETVIRDVLSELDLIGLKIVCVDDGSSDKTVQIVSEFPNVFIVRHLINRGQGAAIETGFEFIRRNFPDTDYVFTFDSDGQHDSKDLVSFIRIAKQDEFDLMLGNRFLSLDSNVPVLKAYLLKLSAFSTRIFLGLKIHDRHNGFRCINFETVKNLKLSCDSYEHADEILHFAKKRGLRLTEVPVTIRYTDYSKSKGQPLVNIVNMITRKVWG